MNGRTVLDVSGNGPTHIIKLSAAACALLLDAHTTGTYSFEVRTGQPNSSLWLQGVNDLRRQGLLTETGVAEGIGGKVYSYQLNRRGQDVARVVGAS